MTISTTTRKAGPFPGNGATTNFPFGFKVFKKTDLVVTLTDALGVDSVLTLDSHYSVTLNDNQSATPGGKVIYPISGSPMPVGTSLSAASAVPDVQPTDLQNMGGYYPKVIEDALDRLTILVQQLGGDVTGALEALAQAEAELEAYVESLIAGITTPTFQSIEPTLLVDGADYTSGTSESVTLPDTAVPKTIVAVFFDGVFQSRSQWELQADDTTLQFTDVIPLGIEEINVVYFAPALLGSFLQSGNSARLRTFQDKARDAQLAITDFPMLSIAAQNDTSAVESAMNKALETGRPVELPFDRDVFITRPIELRPRSANSSWSGGVGIHTSRANGILLRGRGGRAIKAGPTFSGDYMLRLIFDSDNAWIAPQWSAMQDFILDGSGVADTALVSDYCMNVELRRMRITGVGTGLKWIGYGVSTVDRCYIYASNCIDYSEGGGDSWVTKGDFYPTFRGIILGTSSGDFDLESTVFTRQDEDFPSDSRPIALVSDTTNRNIRDIRVRNCEFSGMTIPVSLTGDASRSIKRVILENNHTTPSAGGGVWSGVLCYLENIQEAEIAGNFIGFPGNLTINENPAAGVTLLNCVDVGVHNNQFDYLRKPALNATNCVGVDFSGNRIRNVGMEGSTSESIYLENTTTSLVNGNLCFKTETNAGATVIAELGTSTDNKGVGNLSSGYATFATLAPGSTSTYS